MTIVEEEEVALEVEDEVEAICKGAGIIYVDGEPLRVGPKERERDRHRWELDPASADDYLDRMHDDPDASMPLRHMRHEHRQRR